MSIYGMFKAFEESCGANFNEIGIAPVLIIFLAAYAFLIFRLRKMPDPGAQFGFSVTGFAAAFMACALAVCSFVFILIVGAKYGYFFIAIVLPLVLLKIANKMTGDNEDFVR